MQLTRFGSIISVLAAQAFAQDAPGGAALYQQFCAQCHGADLRGGNAQSMVDGVWQFGDGKWYLTSNVKHGITDLGMPAYESSMSDAQIGAVVDYILSVEKSTGAAKPPPPAEVQTQDYHVKVDQWVQGLKDPWGIAFPDNDTVLLTEQEGRLRIVRKGALDPAPVNGTPEVLPEGQGGLMDVAVDPDYAENAWVYLAFSHALPEQEDKPALAMTKIVRGKIANGAWTDEQTVFEAPHETYLTTRIHYGCRIVFDTKGHLFFSIGERGMKEHAQDLGRPNGKIHRIRPDGSIPKDNPFARKRGAMRSIYSYGNRNAQGLAIHPETGYLWETEHGPMGGDEINVIEPGKNYGWPVITWGRDYSGAIVSDLTEKDGLEQPASFWRPSIAVCGIDFYSGDQFPKWNNSLLVTALRNEELRIVRVTDKRVMHQEVILKNVGRVRDVGCGPDGAIYVVTNDPGAVLKLTCIKERSYKALQ
ncbi:MAG: PQQ-dependent sugar dehydrogenase [Candidatus Hydrogenedentes bacterium]|nr:PQQ-dependent sugar dehydrogenase [Candidatus Hydrogenedentota bacterium]